ADPRRDLCGKPEGRDVPARPAPVGDRDRDPRRASRDHARLSDGHPRPHPARRAPSRGFAAEVPLAGTVYRAVVNIGTRPTFQESGAETIEVHLLDYGSGDLYGRVVEVRFLVRIRGEMKFDSPDALKRQISADKIGRASWRER